MLVEHLKRTRDALLRAADGVSEVQSRFSPGDGCWSIREIVEHVTLVERRIVEQMATKMPEAPPPSGEKLAGPARFARLDDIIPTRGQRRLSAPETFRPVGTWPTVREGLAAFRDVRDRSIALAEAAGPDVASRVLVSRAFGELDLEEWLYFASLHAARHTEQIAEITQAAGFPAG